MSSPVAPPHTTALASAPARRSPWLLVAIFLANCSGPSVEPLTALEADVAAQPDAAPEEALVVPDEIARAAQMLTEAGQGPAEAWERLAYLSDHFGNRLSGSKGLEGAIDWSLEIMREDGLTKVRREKIMVPHWVRGEEWAKMSAPVERSLRILGIGGSIGTSDGPISGEVEVVENLAEIESRSAELRGKIVLINQPMPGYDPETGHSGYGDVAEIRVHGASKASRAGAIAVLVRSLTAHSLATPHTGMLRYDEESPPIPAACVTIEDAEFLARSRKRGSVTVELFLGAQAFPDAESGNAIAELTGRELPEEIVVIGAHIDAWDVGDGSVDNGSGVAMVLEAARLLKSQNLIPRRTIRVVMFTNEENGMRGAKGYFAAHGEERHVAAMESDAGAGEPRGFGVTGSPAEVAALQAYSSLFQGLGAAEIQEGWAGVDLLPLTRAGVLGVGIHPDATHYFDYHHSPADTLDKIDPRHLQLNSAAMALMAYILAERE